MSKLKVIISLVVLIIFASISISMAEEAAGGAGAGSSSNSGPKIYKFVGIVERIENNTLYLQNNKKKYDLSNVKVIYDKGKQEPNRTRKAEMYFVNDVLKEVKIYY